MDDRERIAVTETEVKNIHQSIDEIRQDLRIIEKHIASLHSWRQWMLGIGSMLAVIVGLLGAKVRQIFGIAP